MTFTYVIDGVASITDSLGRVVTIDYKIHDPVSNKDYDRISYKGFGGATRTIKLWYSSLGNRIRPDIGSGAETYASLFPALNGSEFTTYNPKVVSEIELPDGRQYLLKYNFYGELARVDLPTGGRIEYDYGEGVTGGDTTGVVTGQKAIYRQVTERRVYKDAGTTLELRETYSRPESTSGNQGYVEVKHKDAAGTILARDRHFYFGTPRGSFFKNPYEYSSWKDGKEYKTELYEKNSTGSSGLLRTVDNTWQQPTAGNTWPISGQGETDANAKPNQPQVTATTTTLNDTTQVSKQTFTYDQYTNKTEVQEYDFGTPGTLVRKTQTTYLVSNLSVNYTTVNPNTTNPDPHATIHLRSLPLQQSVYDNASAEKARTTYEYDNYTEGLTNRSSISGHASVALPPEPATHTVSYETRGNVTAHSVWELPSTQLTTRMQYDIAGNAVSVTDPKNNPPTLFDFSDRYGIPDDEAESNTVPVELSSGLQTYALATLVTNALGHTAYTQYDYYLGKPVNGEDANGVVAKGRYDDLLDRGTELVVAENVTSLKRKTQFTYNDAARMITTQGDQTTYDDRVLKSQALYDGLGRTTETRQYETGSAYIATLQNYDGLGRVVQTSNPYRPASESLLWTTTVYDGLGRVLTVTTPDNAVVSTFYDGPRVLVKDQADKERLCKTDGLGRLTDVWEIRSADTVTGTEAVTFPNHTEVQNGYRTKYTYDALDDLTEAKQQIGTTGTTQTRTFGYDGLKRLITAFNPESGTISYSYDNNSNLLTKTDSRVPAVITTYDYDALNRAKSRTYSGISTPTVSYKYDGQGLPPGAPVAPSFARGYSTGRLVAVTYGGTSAGNYTGYDQLGRANVSVQQTDSQNYGFSYGYDLAGAMTTETYPSLRQITTGYDAAGRISTIDGQKSGEQNKTYASQFSYAAHGAAKSLQLGNSKWEHTNFNSRLQPLQIGLGTSATNSSVLQLDYAYGTTTNNGNVISQTITAPGLTVNQCYGYDSLNRLSTAEERSGGTTCAGTQQWKQAFSYDRYGNRNFDVANTTANVLGPNPTISQSTNRFTAGQNYGYDNAGNLTSDPTTPVNGIIYDAENRQTQYTKSGQATNYYLYDGDGHRVKKIDGSGTTVFVYNVAGQLIAEYHSDPVPPPAGGGGTSYLTSDHLGSTRVVTKSDGTVKARYDYLPFGEELGAGIGQRTTGMGYNAADSTKQKFTQKERDNESGLDYFGARYYSSAQGRFTGVDPATIKKARLLDPQRINLYPYVRNNPLKYIDPDGADLLLAQGISKKDREFTVKNLARYYMTEAGKKVIEHLDKVPFRIALGKSDLERKELNPAKMGEFKIGGQEKVTAGLTTVPYSAADGQKFLAAEAVGDKKPGPAITVDIDPSNSSDIGKDPARVMAHELGGHTSEAVDLAMRPTPGDPKGEYGPGRNITEYFGKGETASEAAEKAAGKLPDKPTPEAIKAVEEILKRREQ
jgi:RHS repeat-associated protein